MSRSSALQARSGDAATPCTPACEPPRSPDRRGKRGRPEPLGPAHAAPIARVLAVQAVRILAPIRLDKMSMMSPTTRADCWHQALDKRAIAKASGRMQILSAIHCRIRDLKMQKFVLGVTLAALLGATVPGFAQEDDGQQNGAGAAFGAVLGGLVGGVVGAAVSGHAPKARDLVSGTRGGDREKGKAAGGMHAAGHASAAKAAPARKKPGK